MRIFDDFSKFRKYFLVYEVTSHQLKNLYLFIHLLFMLN